MKIYKTGRGDEVFLDDEDFDYLINKMKYTYCTMKNKKRKIIYVCRNIPTLLSGTGKRKTQYIHWDILGHPGKGMVTDHIDGNPLNNQKNNLRICSYRKNSQNFRHENNITKYSSKYSGVCWHKRAEKWIANISIDRNSKHLGYFINEEDASKAYNNECKSLRSKNKSLTSQI